MSFFLRSGTVLGQTEATEAVRKASNKLGSKKAEDIDPYLQYIGVKVRTKKAISVVIFPCQLIRSCYGCRDACNILERYHHVFDISANFCWPVLL